jgi:hypothetical protein
VTAAPSLWGADVYLVDRDSPLIPQFMDFALAQVVSEYIAQKALLPERRYWTIGSEAFECEQVVLSAQTAVLGTAGAPVDLSKCTGPRSLSFNVQIVRCTPIGASRGRAPSAQSIQDAANPTATDMDIMIYHLPARFDVYQTGIVASVSASSAEGGLHGAVGSYTVNL